MSGAGALAGNPPPSPSSPSCDGGAAPACFLPWVLRTSQEMLTGETSEGKAQAPLPASHGLAVACVYLLTREAAHNQFLLKPLPSVPETPELHATAQSSWSGPQPSVQLTLPPLRLMSLLTPSGLAP